MEYRNLGKSGVQVSVLSLGAWLTFGKQVENQIAEECMKFAYDQGINFFDNAEGYALGQAEIVMGQILKKMNWPRDSYLVSSKVFFGIGGKMPNQTGLSRKHVVDACHAALRRLQVDYLDLFFCHRPDPKTPVEETVWTMHNLIQQGKILYWGTSEWSAQEIQEAYGIARQYNLIPPTMEQPQYNMLWRDRVEQEYKRLYETVGLGTTVWSPLATGILTGKYNEGIPEATRLSMSGLEWLKDAVRTEKNLQKVKQLSELAQDLGVSMANLALAWVLKNPNVSTAITGASKLSQLEENLKALNTLPKLTNEIMEKIEAILKNKPRLLVL
jgi:voltage-dependent potassium channel beta subunit